MNKLTNTQRGIGLVEIMLAMVISLLLLAGVVDIFLSSKQSYRMVDAMGRIQEDGRYAMEAISRDIRMTDFWGCVSEASRINNLTPDTDSTKGIAYDSATKTLTLTQALGPGIVLPNGAPSSGDITLPPDHTLGPNDVVLVSDCQSGEIFEITNDPNDPAAPGIARHDSALSRSYSTDARLYPLGRIAYRLDGGSLLRGGDPSSGAGTQTLIDNVADLKFLLGVDTDGDGAPNYYAEADEVASSALPRVNSIRVELLLRSAEGNLTTAAQSYVFDGESVTAADDGHLWRSFTTTVAIRNRVESE